MTYRRYGQALDEIYTTYGLGRACDAFLELDKAVRRFQKVKKVFVDEVATLKAMRKMIDDILEIIEAEGKEVSYPE